MGFKYNEFCPHSGEYCYGKTPTQIFLVIRHIVQEKDVICLWINLTVLMSLKAHYKLSVEL